VLLVKILTESGNVEFRPHARQEMAKEVSPSFRC
jgi:hypothetical protein